MAKTKTGKTTKGSRQPQAKRLGIKHFGAAAVKTGNIIVRQKGTKFHPGEGVKLGNDYTLYAIRDGKVKFYERSGKHFVSVVAAA